MSLRKQFAEPGPEYRSAPFWAWNDELDPAEIRRQLALMKAGGYGGAFFHSREGLITPYLGRAWDRAIESAVRACRDLGIVPYLYDEDRWPSGFAGNRVTRKLRNQMKMLVATRRPGGKLSIAVETQAASVWFNNTPYLDTLNDRAVQDFIRSTYDHYAATQGKGFGRLIPAIFTDEPNYYRGGVRSRGAQSLPFTPDLPQLFNAKYGYDLMPEAASLFERRGRWQQVRHDYWRLVTALFRERYYGQIFRWCERHGIALTGHNLEEDTIDRQIRHSGPAMPTFAHFHIPGIDKLRRNIEHPLTLKQCSSAANQLGRSRTLSELFGGCGQDMSFTDRKWIGDWHFALGINFFCPHLALYSMAGCRKRDYPPTLSWQQPWWKENKTLEDHFARLALVLSRGRYAADVLVLHPVESGFHLHDPLPPDTRPAAAAAARQEIERLQKDFDDVLDALWKGHIEFDLGDEALMADLAKADKTGLRVGKMIYRAVVLPPLHTLRASTLALLKAFHRHGGLVLRPESLPGRVDGRENPDAADFLRTAAHMYADSRDLPGLLGEASLRPVRILDGECDADDLLLHRRFLPGNRQALFLANTNERRGVAARVELPDSGAVERWDTWTGRVSPVPVQRAGRGRIAIPVSLPPAGSALWVFSGRRKADVGRKSAGCEEVMIARASLRPVRPLDPNSLVLDTASVRDKNGRWSAPMPVWRIQDRLKASAKEGARVTLRYVFGSELTKIPEDLALVLERSEAFRVWINGARLDTRRPPGPKGFWIDPAFHRIPFDGGLLQPGRNEIVMETAYRAPTRPDTLIYRKGGTEIEAVYLVGSFAVRGDFDPPVVGGCRGRDFSLADSAECSSAVSITENGYPFYAGRFLFEGEVNLPHRPVRGRVELELDRPHAISFRIRVNGREAGAAVVPPFRVDISRLLRPGISRIEVEAAGSLRNLLGPHHHAYGDQLMFVAPRHFVDTRNWIDDYALVSFGVEGVRIIVG